MICFVLRLLFLLFLRCYMKKNLLFFALIITLLIPVNVYADPVGGVMDSVEDAAESSSTESESSDNLDRYLNGDDSVDMDNVDEPIDDYVNQSVDRDFLNNIQYTIGGSTNPSYCPVGDAFEYNLTVESNDGVIFIVYYPEQSSGNLYHIYCFNREVDSWSFRRDGGIPITITGTEHFLMESGFSDSTINMSNLSYSSFPTRSSVFADIYNLQTAIPIFDSSSSSFLDDVNACIRSFGTTFNGAMNEDYVQLAHDRANLSSITNSDDIPTPKVNALETFDSNDEDVFKPRSKMSVLVSSYVSDKDLGLTYDVQVGAQCTNRAGNNFTLSYKYFYMGNKVDYQSDGFFLDKQYLFNDVSKWIHSCSDISRVNRLYVRVRFRDNLKASNWVQVVFANGSNSTTAYEQDNEGNYVEDGDYTGGMLPGDTSTGYSPGGFLGDNINFFMSYIQGGFGLLDGGLLSLLANTFRYIPASIWDLFKAFISSIIIVTMIVLIVRAVSSIASAVGSVFSGLGK